MDVVSHRGATGGARRHPVIAMASLLAVAAMLGGCEVGPDFLSPKPPDVKGYTPEPLAATTSSAAAPDGAAQTFVSGKDVPADWWTLFHSEPLDRLVDSALKTNPDLKAAEAALRQARELLYAERGSLYPSVDGQISGARERVSGATRGVPGSSIFNLYQASVDVSYGLDLFGGERRLIESDAAQAEFQGYQRDAAYLTLTANVVALAIQEASLRDQIAATKDIVKSESDQLDLVRRQFNLGAVSRADVLAQQASLAQSRATLPPLEKQLAQTRNGLTALAGRLPSQEIEQRFNLSDLGLPQDLPVSLPSQLVEQRPDIRAQEALLHSASAQVGVATANQFPQFSLSASFGSAATRTGNLFSSGSNVWNFGANLLAPIFEGGTLMHEKRAAVAAYDEAAANYRSTVLKAFQNVADTLRALQSDAEALKAQAESERAASESLTLARDQFRNGAISYLQLLNADRTYQQARLGRVQAQAARLADTVVLFQALGGGWWNRTTQVSAGR